MLKKKLKDVLVGKAGLAFIFHKAGLAFIFLLGFIPLFWFGKGLWIAGGDDYSLLDPAAANPFFQYSWNIKLPNAGGVTFSIPSLFPWGYFFGLFKSFGWSIIATEKLWFCLLFLLPGLSMYYLMSQIYDRSWAKIIASVFYMFNLFLVVVGPTQKIIKLVLIALPLMLAFYIKGLEKNKESFLKYSVLIGFCSLIFGTSNVNLPSVVAIPMTLFFYLLFFFLFSGEKKEKFWRSVKFSFVTLVCYLLFNLWWFSDFLASIVPGAGAVKGRVSFSALGAGGITEYLRLLGSWGWKAMHYKMYYYPFNFNYDKPFLLILTFSLTFLVFLAILLKPKDRYIRFFSFLTIIGLFFTKGGAAPFGSVYAWLWNNFPGFWIFREPFTKFTPVTVFSYSVLLGISVDLIFQKIKESKTLQHYRGFYKLFWGNLFPFLVILAVFAASYPLVNGEVIWDYWNGSMRSFKIKVPDYWYQTREWLDNNDEFGRVFLTPKNGYGVAYNWEHGFSTADAPAIYLLNNPSVRSALYGSFTDSLINEIYDSIDPTKKKDFARSLSLLNTKYVLQQNDLDWHFALANTYSPKLMKNYLTIQDGISLVKSFGELDLYKINDGYYLPHFYPASEIYFLSNNQSSLPIEQPLVRTEETDQKKILNVVSLGKLGEKPAIYLENLGADVSSENDRKILDLADNFFAKGELENQVDKQELGISIFPDSIFLFDLNPKPESPTYPLALMAEQFEEWKLRNKPEDLFWKRLTYATRRISEISVFKEPMDSLLNNYEREMKESIKIVEGFRNKKSKDFISSESNLFISFYTKMKALILTHRHWVEDVNFNELEREKIRLTFRRITADLERLKVERDFSKLVYQVNIPKDGRYEVYFKNASGDWTLLGRENFKAGKQKTTLSTGLIGENLVDQNLNIKGYSPNSVYKVSFNYKTGINRGNFTVTEGEKKIVDTGLFSTGEDFEYFEMFLFSSPEGSKAALSFSAVEYKDLKIEQIIQPEFMFRMTNLGYKSPPKINFSMINPTKYKVKVQGATEQYILVFSESFHKNWKVYLSDNAADKSFEKADLNETKSYFDGEVIESKPQMNFFDSSTLETWLRKPILQDSHYLVNGYANSWIINPKDVDKRENYELIIEFKGQRYLYLGIFVSGISLSGCFGYLIFKFSFKKWHR